jgi:hypothetical protein
MQVGLKDNPLIGLEVLFNIAHGGGLRQFMELKGRALTAASYERDLHKSM